MFRSFIFATAVLLAVRAWAVEPQIINIRTLPGQMRYDVTDFLVAPGAEVRLVFENLDDMPHNLVLFQAGTDVAAVAAKNLEKPELAVKRDWLPDDPRILAHTRAVGPKAREEVAFKAPLQDGRYPFVCTFPGHAQSMRGQMQVARQGPGLTGLKFAVYLGDWKALPDFAALTPHREGAVADNLVQLKFDDYKNQFGVVFTGKVTAAKEGDYTFLLAADDGARLFVGGKKVTDHNGNHNVREMREDRVHLKAGEHDFRLEYFQTTGAAELFVAWFGEDFTTTPLSKWVPENFKDLGPKIRKTPPATMPLVVGTEPVIYRGFMANAGGRPIAVGYPGGFNLAWSVDQLNLALLWRGAFFDAGRHWTDRGEGSPPPLGYDWVRTSGEAAPPFAILPTAEAPWPRSERKAADMEIRADGYQWKGYALDEKRFPTFRYEWGGVKVTDRFDVQGEATAGGKLVRTLKLAGPIPANAWLRVGVGTIQPAEGGFLVDGGAFGPHESKYLVTVEGGRIAGSNLLVPARAEIKITYAWPGGHAGHAH
ncbi:MAG: hypothetical protein K8R23_02640 [Chthoniobacter sp.]|nr:hypothetical protein [Chthoniobacter sp.]